MHSHVVEFLAAVFACFNVLSIIARRCLKSLKVKSEVQILFKLSRFRKWNTHTVQQTLGITKKKWVIKEQNLPNLCYSDVPKWTLVKLDHFPCLARDRKSPQRRIIAHIFGKEVVCIGEKSVSQAACLLSEVNKYTAELSFGSLRNTLSRRAQMSTEICINLFTRRRISSAAPR